MDSSITEYDPNQENITAYFQTSESYTECDCPGFRSNALQNSYDIFEITTELQNNSSEITRITTQITSYAGRNQNVHAIEVQSTNNFKVNDFIYINADHQSVRVVEVFNNTIRFSSNNQNPTPPGLIIENLSRFKIQDEDVDKFVTGCSVQVGDVTYDNVICNAVESTILLDTNTTLPTTVNNGDVVSNFTDEHYVKVLTNTTHTYTTDQRIVFDVVCLGKVWTIKKTSSSETENSFYISPTDDSDEISLANESNTQLVREPIVVSLNQESRTNDRVDLTISDKNRIIEFGNVGDDTTAVNTDGYAFGSTNVFGHKRLDYIKVTWSEFLDE